MKIYKLALILCVILGGCGQDRESGFVVAPELTGLWNQYTQTLTLSGIDWGAAVGKANLVAIEAVPPEAIEGKAGVCLTEEERLFNKVRYTRRIKMASDRLNDWSTFYHELGHCIFNLKHNQDPDSLMFFSTQYSDYWTTQEKTKAIRLYIKEIKGE